MTNKAVFLDRDGVINHDPDDYTYLLDETTILPGIVKFAQKLKKKGFTVIGLGHEVALLQETICDKLELIKK